MVKNSPANAGDTGDAGLIPRSGRSPGGGNSNPLQYSCLENPMDRGAWWAVVHKMAKTQTQLSMLTHVLIFRTKLYFQVIMSIFLQIFVNIGFIRISCTWYMLLRVQNHKFYISFHFSLRNSWVIMKLLLKKQLVLHIWRIML